MTEVLTDSDDRLRSILLPLALIKVFFPLPIAMTSELSAGSLSNCSTALSGIPYSQKQGTKVPKHHLQGIPSIVTLIALSSDNCAL